MAKYKTTAPNFVKVDKSWQDKSYLGIHRKHMVMDVDYRKMQIRAIFYEPKTQQITIAYRDPPKGKKWRVFSVDEDEPARKGPTAEKRKKVKK